MSEQPASSAAAVAAAPTPAAAASPSAAAATAAPASSSTSAAAAAGSAASASPAAAPELDLLRENSFYLRPPQEFLDDVANAATDYLADGCDALEKAINQQVVKRSNRKQEIGAAVDAFFTGVDERLQAALPEFEAEVLRSVLRIPADVVVGSELAAAADGFGAISSGAPAVPTPAQVEEEAAVERELVQLQQRVARAAKLNRALRTELARFEQDAEAYAQFEDAFVTTKKQEAANAKLVSDLSSLTEQAAQLRPLHAALTHQFVEVYGADGAGDLTGISQARAATAASAAGSASAAAALPASESDAPFGSSSSSSSVTQQINLATLRAQQADDMELTAALPAPAAASATGSGAAATAPPAAAPTASSMNISEEAASDFF